MTMLADTSPENTSFFPPDSKKEINKTNIKIEKETKINYFDFDSNNVKENLSTNISDIKEDTISNNLDSQTPINNFIENQTSINNLIENNQEHINQIPTKNLKNRDALSIIENYIKENKYTVIGIGIFLIIFLMIFSRRK